ncbi:MAG: hydroxyacid dehydrogenase [Candidatus Thermoplasmatota archaeon]|nr:hydroxyacid dehydrogenase [Candidatus Thermoplasmatota archaeon]
MKILVTDPLAEEAMDMLRENHEVVVNKVTGDELAAVIGPYHALMVRSGTQVTPEVIRRADNLQVIGRAGIGVDNIDVKAASAKGIKVVNSPTGATPSVAELAIGHMISLARHLPRADRTIRSGEWAKKQLKGVELHGKTLGLVGCGNIGQLVARIARSLDMTVIGYDPYMEAEEMAEHHITKMDSLDDLMSQADFISLHVPHTKQTHHLIDAGMLAKMKPTAFLVNCARGGVVDEEALYQALKAGRIAGAALDVYEKEPPGKPKLAELDNVVFTPHLGAATREGQIRAGTVCAEQVLKVLAGEEPDFWVNRA